MSISGLQQTFETNREFLLLFPGAIQGYAFYSTGNWVYLILSVISFPLPIFLINFKYVYEIDEIPDSAKGLNLSYLCTYILWGVSYLVAMWYLFELLPSSNLLLVFSFII